MKKRQLAILGSTGSIGTQALEVISAHSDLFEVYALTCNNQVDLLIEQARRFMPEVVVIANEQKYPELREALEDLPIKVWAGSEAIAQLVRMEPIDMVLTAMVGYAGLRPTIEAIKAADSAVGADIAAALPSVSTTGVTGSISFDEIGDANKDMAYIKKANTETVAFDFVKTQTVAELTK